jgi:hypothetical protein
MGLSPATHGEGVSRRDWGVTGFNRPFRQPGAVPKETLLYSIENKRRMGEEILE